MTTLKQALSHATNCLRLTDSSTPALDAELLLAHCLTISRSDCWRDADKVLTADQLSAFDTLIQQRCQQIPVAYLTGHCEFWSLPLFVTPAVLIPRPETEHLVEVALASMAQPVQPGVECQSQAQQTFHCLELGTGSGAIACALAHSRPQWHITAVDASAPALAVAAKNVEQLGLANITLLQSDWFAALPPPGQQRYDLIISNPPYLAADDPHLQTAIRHEPLAALVAGQTGLEDYQAIVAKAGRYAAPGAGLVFEHGIGQAEPLANLLKNTGFSQIQHFPDLAGILRVIFAKMV